MGMSVLTPVAVTDSTLVGSTVPEDATPAWAPGTTYPQGARVHRAETHRVYVSLLAGNTNNTPETSPGWWFNTAPTNRWAMFDHVVQTATTSTDDAIVLNLRPGPVDAVLFAQLSNVRSIDVTQRRVGGAEVVYSQRQRLDRVAVVDWRTWTTAPFRYRRECAFLGLQPYFTSELEIVVNGTGQGAIGVGVLAVGSATEVGEAQRGLGFGGISYARVTTDDYGTTSITPGARAKELDFELLVPADEMETVADVLEGAKTTPSGFIPTTKARYSSLITFGLVDTYKAALPEADWVTVRGRIKGST